ncbi:unnamed protein product [Pedinophyceae sp. YPF-701]|nr:unnamed protein product [Pedinophyceae sp. YPF-701]
MTQAKHAHAGGAASSECVKVVVRCRPLNDKEVSDGRTRIVDMDTKMGQVSIRNPKADPQDPPKQFTFDYIYDWTSQQLDIYNEVARPLVNSVLDGYNGTIFAYGQTGTGKTHTMEGKGADAAHRGIIPNSFDHVFASITGSEDQEFLVRVSMLEIYNEEIRDLLSRNPKNKLELKETAEGVPYVKDLSTFVVRSAEEIQKVLDVGRKNRSVGETQMNRDSSRSHCVFTVTVESANSDAKGNEHVRVGKLNLVDLAGSERVAKTGATGARFKEGVKINMSLSALGNVISALVDSKVAHIPYRDSKLTRLLQDSLGGNTKTVMIANIGPADWNFDETMSTLRYANRAKNIQNKPRINEDPKDAMIREYQDEMKRLQKEIEDMGEGGEDAGPTVQEIEERVEKEMTDAEKERLRQEVVAQLTKDLSKQGSIHLAPDQVAEIEREAEAAAEREKQRIRAERERGLREAAERKKQIEAAKEKAMAAQSEAEQVSAAKAAMKKKLDMMRSKLLHGGKDELAREARARQADVEKKRRELEEHRQQERERARRIQELEEQKKKKELKGKSLEEERTKLRAALELSWSQLQSAVRDVEDAEEEFARERHFLLQQVQDLQSELRLREAIIDAFVPPDERDKVTARAQWDAEAEDWVMGPAHSNEKDGGRMQRPVSASARRRPMSGYALQQAAAGDMNPRFKADNILKLELDMPERTTYTYDEAALGNPEVQQALLSAFVDGQVLFSSPQHGNVYG